MFDLSKLSRIIESERPVCVAVIDTNVLINESSYLNWKVVTGPTLFVLPDTVIQELEYLQKRERREKPDSIGKAGKAVREIRAFFQQGKIIDGISVPGGWAIAVPSPKQDELNAELKQFEDIVEAFGRSDTKLLLLTKECRQSLTTPAVLVTGEVNLYNIAQTNGVPCHFSTGFPLDVPREVFEEIKDWEKALQEIKTNTQQNSIEIEVILTEQKCYPASLAKGDKSLMVAEGWGVMKDGIKTRPFLWTLSYREYVLAAYLGTSTSQVNDLPEIYLDFFGDEDFKQSLFDSIAQRLLDCANPSPEAGLYTLQSAESVLVSLLISECQRKENSTYDGDDILEAMKEYGSDGLGQIHFDWENSLTADELFPAFERFVVGFRRCWTIGDTCKFRIMNTDDQNKALN